MFNFLFKILKPILNRNKVFEDKHKGEEVFIFGNGVSLKNFDLNNFKKKNILSCGYFFLNKSFEDMKHCAHIEIDPFILYPIEKNKFSKKFQKNYIRDIYFNHFPLHKVPLITSMTNLLAFIHYNKIYFAHHFGKDICDLNIKYNDPSEKIMFMKGAMYFLIALSKYMGFEKVYLVGMDYINTIPENGHFYEFGRGNIINHRDDVHEYNDNFFKLFREELDINVINRRSKLANYNLTNIYYEDFFNSKESYLENTEICSKDGLVLLEKYRKQYSTNAKKIYPDL